MLCRICLATVVTLACVLQASAAENAAAAAKDLQPVVDQAFSTTVPTGWRIGKGSWKIVEGAWQGAELAADKHGAVARYNLEFTDALIEFDFRLEGAKALSLSLNDKTGHVCRLAIRAAGFQVLKDDHDHDGPDQRVVLADVQRSIEPGKWHHVRVEIAGPRMTAQVGDAASLGQGVGGEHALIAGKKANLGFTVAGQTASFKNLRVSTPAK